MSDQSPPSSPGATGSGRRRSSIAEIFNPRSASNTSVSTSPTSGPSSIPAPQHRRGMSITTLGFAGSNPNQTSSPFNAFAKQRRASISTSTGSSSPEFRNSFGDEPAVLEEDDHMGVPVNTPATPSFARRVSFGAQALRDVRQGPSAGAPSGGRRPSSSLFTLNENHAPNTGDSPSSAKTSGEGFNWSEAIRDSSKRSPSFSSTANPFSGNTARGKAPSIPVAEPPKEMPKAAAPPRKMKKPDHLGERMLRGDFMMD